MTELSGKVASSGYMTQALIATLLVVDSPEDASYFPQVGHDSSYPSFQAVYWRCVACFFVTSTRQNPDARHVLFTTTQKMPCVDGLEIGDLMRLLDVEVIHLPITHRLGRDKVQSWNNVFYILDVIDYLARTGGYDEAVVMDSDCIWVRPADGLLTDVKRRGVLSMSIAYAYDEKLNGASRRDMIRAAHKLSGHVFSFVPNFSGGEVFAATRSGVADVHRVVSVMWDRLASSPSGDVQVYTEEHLLSIVYEMMGIPIGTADPHIRRLWTALRLNNVSAEDVSSGRCVWHLPMEKKTGFADLFKLVKDRGSWLWTEPPEDMRMRLALVMGLPRRSPRQWASQVQSRVHFYAAKKLSRIKVFNF